MLIGASSTFGRAPVALLYREVGLILLAAIPALALGAPALGYAVGATAWIVGRVASVEVERRIADVGDINRRLGFGVASSMLRVWLLAAAIMIVGLASTRADGLTAALVIFGAFSVYFIRAAVAHRAQRRRLAG
jgi:hypothetical protein